MTVQARIPQLPNRLSTQGCSILNNFLDETNIFVILRNEVTKNLWPPSFWFFYNLVVTDSSLRFASFRMTFFQIWAYQIRIEQPWAFTNAEASKIFGDLLADLLNSVSKSF